MDYLDIVGSCYGGDGLVKLEKAERLAAEYGKAMVEQEDIKAQLAILKGAVRSLDACMGAMDMGKTCSRCAATPDGGCCSAYMGHENNDALQLLMNILAGVPVRQVCDNGEECCFLGEEGCILLFKPIFCLNYLCPQIRETSSTEALRDLEQKTATLLGAQSELEQQLIRFLQQRH